MALTFPYPQQLPPGQFRPDGQGCLSCVRRSVCSAWYWRTRYDVRKPDDHDGVTCASWSNNPADVISNYNQDDKDENKRLNELEILEEPNPSGYE